MYVHSFSLPCSSVFLFQLWIDSSHNNISALTAAVSCVQKDERRKKNIYISFPDSFFDFVSSASRLEEEKNIL